MTNKQTIGGVSLMPCPFCGGKADTKCTGGDYPDWHAECLECGASADIEGPYSFHHWNRRAAQPQGEIERLRRLVDSKEVERQQCIEECAAKVGALRDQLAEAIAVLDHISGDYTGETGKRIQRCLSTSAEPKPRGEAVDNPVIGYADSYRAMARQGVETVSIWSVITDLERNIAPLSAEQPAPVAVVMPERKQSFDDYTFKGCRDAGYNEALDEVAKLNGVKP